MSLNQVPGTMDVLPVCTILRPTRYHLVGELAGKIRTRFWHAGVLMRFVPHCGKPIVSLGHVLLAVNVKVFGPHPLSSVVTSPTFTRTFFAGISSGGVSLCFTHKRSSSQTLSLLTQPQCLRTSSSIRWRTELPIRFLHPKLYPPRSPPPHPHP